MNITSKLTIVILVALSLKSCITPFEPQGVNMIDNMVVIEGNILQNDTTKVMISRSLALNDKNAINYISKASVWVESERGNKIFGVETKKGSVIQYLINTKGIDPSFKYKLCVTISGRKYESEMLSILKTPDIDSIGFYTESDKSMVTFYVNTSDPQNNTKYYKWNFKEDWEFQSKFPSFFEYNPLTNQVISIPYEKNRFYCWNSGVSSSILIASTDHLNEDRVYRKKIVTMGPSDRRINYLYSMELHQLAITKEAYTYWENIRKNSDDIGGIFAPQPSEISGNIRCVSDPKERVLGYISAGVVKKKRIFAYANEIGVYKEPADCDVVFVNQDNPMPFESLFNSGYDVTSYSEEANESYWVSKKCVDCRLFGTKIKPPFWPTNHI